MGVGFNTFSQKTVGPQFIIKNSTTGTTAKDIIVFGIKLHPGQSYDLLSLPYVSEADIQHSLIKGELKNRFLTNAIELVSSNLNLVVFESSYRKFLVSKGFSTGLDSANQDMSFPTIRINPDAVNAPTIIEAGPTLGWLFSVGDLAYFEHPLHPLRDPTQDVVVGLGWAASGVETNKSVSWQIDVGAMDRGALLVNIDATITATDIPVLDIAIYAHTGLIIPAAVLSNPAVDEIHCRIQRVASSNDPVSEPGLHHAVVIQTLAQA